MRRPSRIAMIVALVALGIIATGYLGYLVLRLSFPEEILTDITKLSPDRKHKARLVTREASFDVNVFLEVNGQPVYVTPDFRAPAQFDFREYLFWDKGGTVVVLEVAGKRLFGYDARNLRGLTVAELSRVQLSSFDDLGFAHVLPTDLAPAACK